MKDTFDKGRVGKLACMHFVGESTMGDVELDFEKRLLI